MTGKTGEENEKNGSETIEVKNEDHDLEDERDHPDSIETEVLIKPENKKSIIDDKITQEDPLNRKCSPRNSAFIFSKLVSFFWMTSLFVKGSKKSLEQEDLEGLMPEDCAIPLTEKLERNWFEEAYDENGKMKQNPSLTRAIIKTFGFQYLLIGFFPACSEILRLIQPVFMGLLIDYFTGVEKSKNSAYGYALAIVVCHFAISWTLIPYNYFKQMYGVQLRVGVTGLIYKKILSLSHSALSRATTGKIVNLVSNDAFRFEIASLFIHYIWISPVEFIILVYLLVRELGPSALVGITVLLLLTPLQMVLGKLIRNFRQKILLHSDNRVKIMNEIITGMKVIKLYTWEESFKELIKEYRDKELKALRRLMWARASIMSFFFSAGAFVSFITFMTYVLAGNSLTAKKVFTCVALFNVARLMFTIYLPIGITFLLESKVGIDRITELLVEEELHPEHLMSGLHPRERNCSVKVDNITASWTEDSQTLKGISFELKQNEILAVIGPVGSGKSSLLMTLLGELPLTGGDINMKGKIVYTSQEPWIFNGTLKYNIMFGQTYDEEKYQKVIKACALERDIELLVHGDQTLVGERGVSLSGGQKARVNLARAVYADADIYILDDPLSAVDANVGRHLYDKCINGYLGDKIRVLVTHQMQYLTNANQIVALVDGHCVAYGSYNEVMRSNVDFLSLMAPTEEILDEVIDDEEFVPPLLKRFSRQMTCQDEFEMSPLLIKQRSKIFGRQISCSSMCAVGEATVSVSNDVDETVVYEEEIEVEEFSLKEKKQVGAVGSAVYFRFFETGYGKWVWLGTFLLIIFCQALYQFSDWWLSFWSNHEEAANRSGVIYKDRTLDLGVYAFLTILLVVLGISRAFVFFMVTMEASKRIHMTMFNALMRAPIFFFDTNSVGRILNRFSKDTNLVDDMLSFSLFDMFQNLFIVIGLLILVSINLPLFLAIMIPIVVVFIMLRTYYIKTARELKRIESVARSPLFSHFSTTILGLPTIRSFRVQEWFFDLYAEAQDAHTEAYYTFIGASNWLMFNLDLISGLLIMFCSFVCLVFSDSFQGHAGTVGLLLAYAISIPTVIQSFVRQTTEVENNFTSLERIFEYCDLESEAPAHTDVNPPSDWPKRGSIVFDRLKFSYHRTLPYVLHGITAKIHSMEKIGVCGRTGAGKSSLLSTLFRTSEPCGKIFIDDQDIVKLGLEDLRKKLSIIPQEPMLFSGTLRKNLDPFNEHQDDELWDVLEDVQLKSAVQELPGKLQSEMTESGQNLSVGQRQLICLARAILKKNRILVIDEATANVDHKTDSLIQETIREKFKECTVLTIAHRLHTIMDSDRIMVLDAGMLKEFDEPYHLLRCKGSTLYSLVQQTGHEEAQRLFEMSVKSHMTKIKDQSGIIGSIGDCRGGCCCRDRTMKKALMKRTHFADNSMPGEDNTDGKLNLDGPLIFHASDKLGEDEQKPEHSTADVQQESNLIERTDKEDERNQNKDDETIAKEKQRSIDVQDDTMSSNGQQPDVQIEEESELSGESLGGNLATDEATNISRTIPTTEL